MSSLVNFVKDIKKLFQKSEIKGFILGNSSADYDSVFGSIIYAYYMTTYLKTIYLPLIDCPKADMKLRFEIVQIQQQNGINYEDLLYTEDIPNLFTSNYTFNLYDHNFRQELAEKGIGEIVDHHASISGNIYAPHFMRTVASGLTLLYYLLNPKYLQKFEDKSLLENMMDFRKTLDKPLENYDPLIDEIIIYGILLDSFGLDPKVKGRWNQFDTFAVQKISSEQKLKHNYKDLEQMKTSVERGLQISLQDHLKKDFKRIMYGDIVADFSVMYLPTDLFIEHYWNDLVQHFSKIPNSPQSAYFLMFAFKKESGELLRQLIFRTGNDEFKKVVLKVVVEMKCVLVEEKGEWQMWDDPTSSLSRKLFDKKIKASL